MKTNLDTVVRLKREIKLNGLQPFDVATSGLSKEELDLLYEDGFVAYNSGKVELTEGFLESFGVPIDSDIIDMKGGLVMAAYKQDNILWIL